MNDNLKVLIIDDFEEDVMLCQRALEKSKNTNYETFQEFSAFEAVTAIAENSVDCVLIDYFMPGQNGLELLKDIRMKFPFLSVIIMTGQVNERIAVAAMQAGAQNYISKSMVTSELLDRVIQQAIEHCMMQRCMYEQRTSLEIFTRALAHDLKEPVRTITSFAELIGDSEKLSAGGQQYFKYIKSASARMGKLIDMVYLYTQLDKPGPAKKEICHTDDIVDEVKENLTKLITEKKAVITVSELPDIYANKIHLVQLFQNLIANAVKFGPTNVEVNINAEEYSDNWLFSVSDNGEGIEEQNLEKIFEAFKRLESDDTSGNGMGLAICRKIIETHDGKIWCKSVPGRGAIFYFTIPKLLKSVQPTAEEKHIHKTKMPSFGSKKKARNYAENQSKINVLLVDDHDADVMITKFYLFEQPQVSCNLMVANSTKEAISHINKAINSEEKIDLILLDINMPGSGGFEILKKIRETENMRDAIVIMCSGSSYDKDIDMSKHLGASGYMIKPVRFDKLKAVIEETNTLTVAKHDEKYVIQRTA